jgi:hypothetical protein
MQLLLSIALFGHSFRLRKAWGKVIEYFSYYVLQQWYFISQVPFSKHLLKMGVPDGDAEKGKKVKTE